MSWRKYVSEIDDSHQMTTAREHIAELCEVVEGKDWSILELGSHAGISAAAMAMAASESTVDAVDLCDTVPESERVALWKKLGLSNIRPVSGRSFDYLREYQPYDFIFHDSVHGDTALSEYLLAAESARVAVAIHDFEMLSAKAAETVSGMFSSHTLTPDSRGRMLFIGRR